MASAVRSSMTLSIPEGLGPRATRAPRTTPHGTNANVK